MYGLAVYLLQGFSSTKKKRKEKVNVCVVGLDGIFCKALFGNEVVEEEFFGRFKLWWYGFSGDGSLGGKEKTPVAPECNGR